MFRQIIVLILFLFSTAVGKWCGVPSENTLHVPSISLTFFVTFKRESFEKCNGAIICKGYALGVKCGALNATTAREIQIVAGLLSGSAQTFTATSKTPVRGSTDLLRITFDQEEDVDLPTISGRTLYLPNTFDAVILRDTKRRKRRVMGVVRNQFGFTVPQVKTVKVGSLLFYRTYLVGIAKYEDGKLFFLNLCSKKKDIYRDIRHTRGIRLAPLEEAEE